MLWDHWGLGPFVEGVDLGESSSLNLLVDDGNRRYVVRVHRPHVTAERLGAISQARQALLDGGMPCAPVVPTLRGEPWVCLQGRLIEVEAHVAHDGVMDSWERLEVGMALLAQTHGLLHGVRSASRDAGRGSPTTSSPLTSSQPHAGVLLGSGAGGRVALRPA